MKKILVSLLVSLIAVAPMSAQTPISEKNQKMINREMAQKSLKVKPSDAAKDAAKDYKKDKWKNIPGTLPIEHQQEQFFIKSYELDETGRPAYIFGTATSLGGNMSGAKLSATVEARNGAAANFAVEITGLIEAELANGVINQDVANSIISVVNANKQTISQKLLRGENVVQMYREVKNGKKKQCEVTITVAYEYDLVMKNVKQALIPLMGENGSTFEGIINRAMGF